MKKKVNGTKKKMNAVLVGIAGSHNAFSLSLYNLKAYAYKSTQIQDRWDITVIQKPLINFGEKYDKKKQKIYKIRTDSGKSRKTLISGK
mgnify:CR=1 FL=1